MLKLLLILCIIPVGATEYGPHHIPGVDEVWGVGLSNNATAIHIVETVLSDYNFVGVVPEDNVFDCSDISEIIWYALNKNDIRATLVGNYEVVDGIQYAHMFVWAHASDGVIVIESTGKNWSPDRLGEIVLDPIQLFTRGWVWDSPTEFLKVGNKNDMRGITLDTPIEELPIRKKRPGG